MRTGISDRVSLAAGDDVHTVLVYGNRPAAVLMSMDWYCRGRYALDEPVDLAKLEMVGMQDLRVRIGSFIGSEIVISKRSQAIAAMVPWDWYVMAAVKLGEPTNI